MPRIRMQKRVLGWIGLLAAFVIALVAWTGGSAPAVHHLSPPDIGHNALVVPSEAPSSPSSAVSRPAGTTNPGSGLVPNLTIDKSINPASLPQHSVTISVSSDAPILRMGWIVLYGHPGKGYATQVSSPASVRNVGRGYGLVAAVGAQAAPGATYISCTVTVDGVVLGHHTSTGPWTVTTCVG